VRRRQNFEKNGVPKTPQARSQNLQRDGMGGRVIASSLVVCMAMQRQKAQPCRTKQHLSAQHRAASLIRRIGPKSLSSAPGKTPATSPKAPFACSRNRSPMGRQSLKRQRNAPTVLLQVHGVHLLLKKARRQKSVKQAGPKAAP
jgi:hypothetical protein